jgi:hypothetical protein
VHDHRAITAEPRIAQAEASSQLAKGSCMALYLFRAGFAVDERGPRHISIVPGPPTGPPAEPITAHDARNAVRAAKIGGGERSRTADFYVANAQVAAF